jgi:hypothetical protein
VALSTAVIRVGASGVSPIGPSFGADAHAAADSPAVTSINAFVTTVRTHHLPMLPYST